MRRRKGWTAMAAMGALFFVGTALGGTYALGLALVDGAMVDALGTGLTAGLSLIFWRWITIGAWVRSEPPAGDEQEPRSEPVGPWGVVGQVLMVTVVGGLVAVLLWTSVAERGATRAAEGVRVDAERAARQAGLTVDQVRAARTAQDEWRTANDGVAEPGPSPAQRTLAVPDARVVSVSVDDGRGLLLVRPDRGPPCVVVSVDGNDVVSSAISGTCDPVPR